MRATAEVTGGKDPLVETAARQMASLLPLWGLVGARMVASGDGDF